MTFAVTSSCGDITYESIPGSPHRFPVRYSLVPTLEELITCPVTYMCGFMCGFDNRIIAHTVRTQRYCAAQVLLEFWISGRR